ncbi:MAG: hypothetical protein ACKPJH_19620 [Dolichospermum sp.]
MGLDSNGIKFILYAKSLEVDFSATATIGRQYLYIEPSGLKEILSSFNYQVDDKNLELIFKENDGYAETFLRYIGANIADSFDYSDYEGATHIHDMNLSIPDIYKDKYNVVIDGGALEHIFNFPVAIKNCMEMVKVGGYYIGMTIANNFMGHGFYQFSPELFFRILTKENGYELVKVIAVDTSSTKQWFSIKDPNELKERVTLVNSSPLYLFVIAKKIDNSVAIFKTAPQQSDYELMWQDGSIKEKMRFLSVNSQIQQITLGNLLKKIIPKNLKRELKRLLLKDKSPDKLTVFDPKFFTPFNPKD